MAIRKRPTQDTPPVEQPKNEPEIKGSKEVKVEADKVVDEKVRIDFMSESFSQDHASKKTKENTDIPKSSIPLDKKVGEIREDIKKAEESRGGDKFTFKDILQIATFLINAFDGGLGILLNFIAKDNRVSVYCLPAETKRQLSEQLALILIKYQVKFKIEFMFLITLIIAYIGPVGGALKHRKNVADGTGGPAQGKGRPPKEKPPGASESTTLVTPPDKPVDTPTGNTVEIPIEEKANTFRSRPPRRNSRKKATL